MFPMDVEQTENFPSVLEYIGSNHLLDKWRYPAGIWIGGADSNASDS